MTWQKWNVQRWVHSVTSHIWNILSFEACMCLLCNSLSEVSLSSTSNAHSAMPFSSLFLTLSDNVSYHLLSCDAVQSFRWLPVIWRKIPLPSSAYLWNAGNHLQFYTASQLWRPL
jgi:hypothetical protein